MGDEPLPKAKVPVATYRLQFNRHFTFADAREIVSYLHELGISDLYASSYVAAKKDSLHGYDIVDPTVLNSEIGTEEAYSELVGELRRLDMGQILDFVPNHMCIESTRNRWWMDVLENGPTSPYAHFFDINWQPVKKELTNKVLLPFLADQYGSVLEKGDLRLLFEEGSFFVSYYDARFPIEPGSYLQILRHQLDTVQNLPPDAPPLLELLSIITALQHLPPTTELDPGKRAERYREKEIVKKRLWQLCGESPEIAALIEAKVGLFNGVKGDPRSFDLLDRLLGDQVYRLSYWRVATDEINYRRFFDINGLSAIRMEDTDVFRETHALLLRLIREQSVTGLRIDHVDGLYDPSSYLHRLQKSCFIQLRLNALLEKPVDIDSVAERFGGEYDVLAAAEPSFSPFYIVCEKILLKGERLPEEWPVFGTTGYDFLNYLNGIFVDTENAKAFDKIYERFAGEVAHFAEVVYEKKMLVMHVSLSGEVNTLGHYLNNISEQDRLTRDFTLSSLTRVIREVIAFFPVYRTYTNSYTVREKDAQYIEFAVSKAKRKNPAISASIFDFLRAVLLLRFPPHAQESDKIEWLSFVMRFQQITGPVMAKGLEDTAFYVYNRLVSLNDVGGMPERFGTPLDAFHGQNLERVRSSPHAMLATATHDTKRGADVRARINVLSEIPGKWQKALVKWSRINKSKRVLVGGQPAPDRNDEYLLYQTLIGAWPANGRDATFGEFRERICAYMVKAMREAKVNTSWVNPNNAYEEGVNSFIHAILAEESSNHFLQNFEPLQRLVAHCGTFSSLSQLVLKITSPGVPDFYQGTELWDLSLVDPDNRRLVDYRSRREALADLKKREAAVGPRELIRELMTSCQDGRIKLYLTYRLLSYRREHRGLFEKGDYVPLEARGTRARNVCAFARRANGITVVVAAPRLIATLVPEGDRSPWEGGVWGDSFVVLPGGLEETVFRHVITGGTVTVAAREGMAVLPLAHMFHGAPFAVLETMSGTTQGLVNPERTQADG